MNLRQLEIFSAVVKHGGFSAAARALNMAQPAVSIAVRKLEQSLGLSLLSRGEQALPTAEGDVLLRHAQRLLANMEVAEQEMADLNGLQSGEVRFSTSAMLGSYFFLPRITEFRKHYPGVSMRVINEGTHGARQLLEEGLSDLAVVNLDDIDDNVEAAPLIREEIVACVRDGHPLSNSASIAFADLVRQPLVLYRENYALRRLVENLAAQCKARLNIAAETDLLGILLGMVFSGEAVTVCLRTVAEQEPGLVAVPLDKPVWLPLGLGWKRGKYLSAANRAFVDFLTA